VGIVDKVHRTTRVVESGTESGGRKFSLVVLLRRQFRFTIICIALLEGQEWAQMGRRETQGERRISIPFRLALLSGLNAVERTKDSDYYRYDSCYDLMKMINENRTTGSLVLGM
jgi:hypothetical protein